MRPMSVPRAPFLPLVLPACQTCAPKNVDPRRVRNLVTAFFWLCSRPGRCSGLPNSTVGMGTAHDKILFDTAD